MASRLPDKETNALMDMLFDYGPREIVKGLIGVLQERIDIARKHTDEVEWDSGLEIKRATEDIANLESIVSKLNAQAY
jgi:hypothetical protein